MAQHSRNSSESNSSDSELSDGWNVIDSLEDFSSEDSNNIKANLNLDKHIVDEGIDLVNDKSNHVENKLVYHESSSDGESIEVIDNDLIPNDDLHDSLLLDSYDLVKDIGGEDSETDENLLNPDIYLDPDKIDLWKPFFDKFQEMVLSTYFFYIICGLGCVLMINIFGILMKIMVDGSMDSVKLLNLRDCAAILGIGRKSRWFLHIRTAHQNNASRETGSMTLIRSLNAMDSRKAPPKDFNPSQFVALEDTEELNKNSYADDKPQLISHIDHTNPLADTEITNIFSQAQTEMLSNQDNDIIIEFGKETNNIPSTNNHQLISSDLDTQIEMLQDNSLLKKLHDGRQNIPGNEFSNFEDFNKSNFKSMNEKHFNFDTQKLGKAFKLLSDLTTSQDSKNKLGQTLMNLDYLIMKLTDLESDMKNSPLFFRLKKQQLRISEGFSKKISNRIGKSVDRLVNNIFNKARKLENDIKMEWCGVKEDLVEVKNIQNYLIYDCDTVMKKKDKKIEDQTKHELDKNNVGKEFINKNIKISEYKAQNKDSKGKKFKVFEKQQKKSIIKQNLEKVQYKTYKKKQFKNLDDKNNHVEKRKIDINEFVKKKQREENFKNNNIESQKQQKKNNFNKEKKTIKKTEENLSKKNKSKKYNSNRDKKVPMEYEFIAQEKIMDGKEESKKFIDRELHSCNVEYDTNSNLNIIQQDGLKQWNFFVKGQTDNKTLLSGSWFLESGYARSQARWNDRRTDWVFDRANARRNKKPTSQWFFQRAFSRKQCQKNPNWCKSMIMTLQTNTKFR